MNDLNLSELFESDPRKTKEQLKSERLSELISLTENSTIKLSGTSKIWTVNKADLISKYLYGFLSVTRNGIYIDAFSGPQEDNEGTSWTAKKVLGMDSVFLRKAYLFDQDSQQVKQLEYLKNQHFSSEKRGTASVAIVPGDSNQSIREIFDHDDNQIKANQAALALLDQRTSECSWDLVKYLADLKPSSQGAHRVEIFYFLAQGWIDRALKSRSRGEKIEETDRWWGDSNWNEFLDLNTEARPIAFCEKFKKLGYQYAQSYGMRANDGRIMFWMIHATDHVRAPRIMKNAYNAVCRGLSDDEWKIEVQEDLFG